MIYFKSFHNVVSDVILVSRSLLIVHVRFGVCRRHCVIASTPSALCRMLSIWEWYANAFDIKLKEWRYYNVLLVKQK